MSSESNNATTLAENKVLILYILNLINTDIRQDDLFKIITSINNMNYFIFKQIITDLIDSKLVHLQKASVSIDFTPLKISTDFKLEHPLKVPIPKCLSPSGKTTSVISVLSAHTNFPN